MSIFVDLHEFLTRMKDGNDLGVTEIKLTPAAYERLLTSVATVVRCDDVFPHATMIFEGCRISKDSCRISKDND